MDVQTKIPDNPSNNNNNISLCQPHGGMRWKVRGLPKSVGFIIWGTRMSVPNMMPIHPEDVEIHWTRENSDLLVAIKYEVIKVIPIYPQETSNICRTLKSVQQLARCFNLKYKNSVKGQGSAKSVGFIMWEPWTMSVQDFMSTHSLVVQIFQSGQ